MSTSNDPVTLPHPAPNQAYTIVSALEAGVLDLPPHLFVADVSKDEKVPTCPSLSFLLKHSKTGEKVVFDLGIRKDITKFTTPIMNLVNGDMPINVPQDAADSLAKGGVPPETIKTIIVSHAHFDHVGDHTLFPNATFILGEGADLALSTPYPADPSSIVIPDSFPPDRTKFLERSAFSDSLAGFPAAYDYFQDGSLYIIDSPGHFPGHINVLARTSSNGSWIYLAGDTCHDLRLLRGEKEIFYETDVHGNICNCYHKNKEAAAEHIRRVGALNKTKGVHVLIAHDWQWYEKNKGGPVFFPGSIPAASL
ncbi:hypothetical protein M422DRAFT_36866 [Sphaerobolus stellatus SS14]|uniref:Metallo-beta-lactamase domain-containing protein n=1 Tax=Sphaerobolus stellatus (strain SS14) TaxID=990650 RepID=A0A0C9UWM2_SPHS4|nr:hypothetical protein M422DRAFT_36866 [Sphaerobolus stellatus SS14]